MQRIINNKFKITADCGKKINDGQKVIKKTNLRHILPKGWRRNTFLTCPIMT